MSNSPRKCTMTPTMSKVFIGLMILNAVFVVIHLIAANASGFFNLAALIVLFGVWYFSEKEEHKVDK